MIDQAVLNRRQRLGILAAAFTAWMCAGIIISLFVLIHRQMTLELLGPSTPEQVVARWFAWYQAAFLFGAAVGGLLFGWLGDKIGRTRSLGGSVLSFSLFTLASFFNQDANGMLILRFLASLGIGGVWPNAVAMVAEAWPDASRPFLAGLLGTAANVGFVLLGVVGYLVPIEADSWRWTLIVASTPAVLGIVILAIVPESPRWLASRRVATTDHVARSSLGEVFGKSLISRTIFGILLGAIPVIGSSANANWLVPWTDHAVEQRAKSTSGVDSAEPKRKPDSRTKAKTQITRSGGAVFGSLLGGIVASFLGRRFSYFLISLVAFGLSSFIFSQLEPFHPNFQLFTFLLGFVGIMYFGWLPLFLPELFPTRVRSTGAGISFNAGRVVAALVVLTAGFLLDQFGGDYAKVGFWSGMIYAIGMVLIWIVPSKAAGRLED